MVVAPSTCMYAGASPHADVESCVTDILGFCIKFIADNTGERYENVFAKKIKQRLPTSDSNRPSSHLHEPEVLVPWL